MVTSLYMITLVILVTFLVLAGIDKASRYIDRRKKAYSEPAQPVLVANEHY